jgi:hypothetical protein
VEERPIRLPHPARWVVVVTSFLGFALSCVAQALCLCFPFPSTSDNGFFCHWRTWGSLRTCSISSSVHIWDSPPEARKSKLEKTSRLPPVARVFWLGLQGRRRKYFRKIFSNFLSIRRLLVRCNDRAREFLAEDVETRLPTNTLNRGDCNAIFKYLQDG